MQDHRGIIIIVMWCRYNNYCPPYVRSLVSSPFNRTMRGWKGRLRPGTACCFKRYSSFTQSLWTSKNTSSCCLARITFYPDMPIGKAWANQLLLVLSVRLYGYWFIRRQILHGGSSASWAGNLPFWGTLLPKKSKSDESASAPLL